MEPAIHYILVYPKDRKRARYYLNDNFQDTHSMRYEELYAWLCEYLSPPTTVDVAHYLHTFQPFVVDTKNNGVVQLSLDSQKELEKLSKQNRKIDFDKVYDQALQEYSQSEDPFNQFGSEKKKSSQSMYSDSLNELTNRVLGDTLDSE